MRVDVRPVGRLRGTDPVDVTAALGPVIEAVCASDVDLSRLTVVCDWIQYRSSFREVADYRPVLGNPAQPAAELGGHLHARHALLEVAERAERGDRPDPGQDVAALVQSQVPDLRHPLGERPGVEDVLGLHELRAGRDLLSQAIGAEVGRLD